MVLWAAGYCSEQRFLLLAERSDHMGPLWSLERSVIESTYAIWGAEILCICIHLDYCMITLPNLSFSPFISVSCSMQASSLHQRWPVLPRPVPRRVSEAKLGQSLHSLPWPSAWTQLCGSLPRQPLHLQGLALRLHLLLPGSTQQMQARERAQQELRLPRVRHP